MDQLVEQKIRALATPLWESAARPYGVAMDFWLMAEQMVLEMMAVTTRMQGTAATEMPRPLTELPAAMPVDQVRQLAQYMWESAGRQYGMAQDFWLAAERHVMAMMRAAAASGGTSEATESWISELPRLSPAAYMERIQLTAYQMWEATGRQYGRALDLWLEAEKQTLTALAEMAATPPPPPEDVVAAAHEKHRQRQQAMTAIPRETGDDPEPEPQPDAAGPAAEPQADAAATVEADRPKRNSSRRRHRLALTEDVPPSAT